jgi:TolB-like protein
MSFFAELNRRNVFRVAVAYTLVAWVLIQVSDVVFPRLGLPEWTVTFVIALLFLGFPVALFFAWAYELTPDGLKREKDVDRSESITPYTARKLDRAIMVVLALGLAFLAFDKFVLDPQRDAALKATLSADHVVAVEEARQAGRSEAVTAAEGSRSIAVLAFDDMSPERDQEYLSDGIAEELLNLLAKIPELRVISRSSAFSFKGQNLELTEIAKRLNVGHILEGSVRKSGNRVRITAQLIDARSDTHLWSETYDRTLDDVFAIQDDIAATVVAQLKITLLGEIPRVEETDPEAYALYLQARHLGRQMTAEALEQSNALFEQAVAIDPDYAAAWDGLAINYVNQAGVGLLPVAEGYTRAREATEKALAINPDFAPAHVGLGWIAMLHDNDLAQAVRHFERALQLDPADTDIIGNAATLLLNLGRLDEAVAFNEFAVARDPVAPVGHYNLGISYFYAGRWIDAIASGETALRLSPGRIGAHYFIGAALLLMGEVEAALERMQREPFEGYRLMGLSMAYHSLGDAPASDAALAELIEKYGQDWPHTIAFVLAYRNEADRAFEWLDKAVENGDGGLAEIVANPLFANLHDDPRWLPFLESIGKSPAQLDAIKFEVKLPAQ